MKTFHTIVIGGGPGGLACATILAKQGKEVLLLERNQRIGTKVCAGGIPRIAFSQSMPQDLIEKSFITQKIRSNWQTVTISSPKPIINTVNRGNLGQWMLQEAQQAGATIQSGTRVKEITEHYISTNEEQFGYRHLVGADGSSSLVRRYLNIDSNHVGTGINYQVPGNFDKMEWHLDTDLFNSGYAWIFPHRDSASIGAYASHAGLDPKTLQEKLHLWAVKCGISLNNTKPQAALINFDYQGWKFNNKFLVGDAAGLASGLTGEGIYPAILSGKTVAKTIINPAYEPSKLNRLIQNHQKHKRLLLKISKNKTLCKVIMEILIVGLRLGIFHFSDLEMGA